MGRFLNVSMPWHRGAKAKAREKRVTQNDPPTTRLGEGDTQKCSQNFQLVLPPGTLQSDVDQKIFYPDGRLRPQWKAEYIGTRTKRGWEILYTHKKTGGNYDDVELVRRRGYWKDITEDMRQKELASKFAPSLGSGGGFRW
ncbi:hypothetical protein CNMCM8980_006749 [Aspergillus fumigatiaffinis]|nr:hypothetical protein CNMCM8980_006749 [Aspergillus fumigatiaffinis]